MIKAALETVRDAANIAHYPVTIGFNLASAGTSTLFKKASETLNEKAQSVEESNYFFIGSWTAMPLKSTSSLVSSVGDISVRALESSKNLTTTSLSAADWLLEAIGVEKGKTYERVGVDNLSVIKEFSNIVIQVAGEMPDDVSLVKFVDALVVYAFAQRCMKQVEDKIKPMLDDKSPTNKFITEEMKLMIKYAIACYGYEFLKAFALVPITDLSLANDRQCLAYFTGVDPTMDIVKRKMAGELYNPGYFIVLDHARELIVVAFRGTIRLQDVLTDIKCAPVEYSLPKLDDPNTKKEIHPELKGFVHNGFQISCDKFIEENKDTLLQLKKQFKSYRLVVTGHSMGAAVGSLVSLRLSRLSEFADVKCYAYAPPSILDLKLATCDNVRKIIKGMIVGDDFVPRLSLPAFVDLRNAAIQIARGEGIPEGLSAKALAASSLPISSVDPQLEKQCCELMTKLRSEAMTSDKLYPAGNLCYVEYDDYSKKRPLDNKEIGELTVSPVMFICHFPQLYMNSLNA